MTREWPPPPSWWQMLTNVPTTAIMASLWQRTLCYGDPLSSYCLYYSTGRSFKVGGNGKDRCARKIWGKVGNVCGKIHINDNTRKCIRLHSVTLSPSKCLPFCTLQSKSKHSEHRRWWWTCTGECWLQWWCDVECDFAQKHFWVPTTINSPHCQVFMV